MLPGPTNFTPTQTQNTLRTDLKWDAVAGAISYKMEFAPSGSINFNPKFDGVATSATFWSLAAGKYDFRVAARDSAGQLGTWTYYRSFVQAAPGSVVVGKTAPTPVKITSQAELDAFKVKSGIAVEITPGAYVAHAPLNLSGVNSTSIQCSAVARITAGYVPDASKGEKVAPLIVTDKQTEGIGLTGLEWAGTEQHLVGILKGKTILVDRCIFSTGESHLKIDGADGVTIRNSTHAKQVTSYGLYAVGTNIIVENCMGVLGSVKENFYRVPEEQNSSNITFRKLTLHSTYKAVMAMRAGANIVIEDCPDLVGIIGLGSQNTNTPGLTNCIVRRCVLNGHFDVHPCSFSMLEDNTINAVGSSPLSVLLENTTLTGQPMLFGSLTARRNLTTAKGVVSPRFITYFGTNPRKTVNLTAAQIQGIVLAKVSIEPNNYFNGKVWQ